MSKSLVEEDQPGALRASDGLAHFHKVLAMKCDEIAEELSIS
ncbi:hypothetical protein SR870_02815 [Rhodopseudomonas palustris]|nr:hypothetical protein [Rhodopseudomonas palustris]WQH00245.1 hypothetical protein SR870_02815 [Rhodopseudomonas palustris]